MLTKIRQITRQCFNISAVSCRRERMQQTDRKEARFIAKIMQEILPIHETLMLLHLNGYRFQIRLNNINNAISRRIIFFIVETKPILFGIKEGYIMLIHFFEVCIFYVPYYDRVIN